MDVRKAIATVPILRRAWRILPGPLRIPLLLVGAIVWLWRRGAGDGHDPAA